MTLDEFQQEAARTINPKLTKEELYAEAATGVASEAGELCNLLKKEFFQGHFRDKSQILSEGGDCLWYVALLATAMDVNLSDIAKMNIAKLKKRFPDGFSEERSRNRT